MLYLALALLVTALAAGWLNRELVRRAGVIQGTDFFVVKARYKAIPHLVKDDSIAEGGRLATFADPEADRQEEQLRGEILVLEEQIASLQLKPLALDPEVVRSSQNATDAQRDRLVQLGYGVIGPAHDGLQSPQTLAEDERTAAQLARSQAAEKEYQRTVALVSEGVEAPVKLESAKAAAQTAAQELRERQNLIQSAMQGSDAVSRTQASVLRDGQRAGAERSAELAELGARLAEYQGRLLQLRSEGVVTAPFAGTVVYRNSAPGIVEDSKVILAFAKGSGFMANIEVPAREAALLEPGQELRLKLKHSLVSEEVTGHLHSAQLVPGYPDRRDLRIECELPPEQFAEFASKSIPVILQWRPPLYTDRIAQIGLLLSLLSFCGWLLAGARAKLSGLVKATVGASLAPSPITQPDQMAA
jgi:hypothetical protein